MAYIHPSELVKLSQLRAKTDHQLLKLIRSKLELSLRFVALTKCEDGDHAEQLFKRAEQAVTEVRRLLPVLSEDQLRDCRPTLNKLEEALDRAGGNTESAKALRFSLTTCPK